MVVMMVIVFVLVGAFSAQEQWWRRRRRRRVEQHPALPALLAEVLRVLVPFPVRLAAKVAAAAGERTAVRPVPPLGTFAATTSTSTTATATATATATPTTAAAIRVAVGLAVATSAAAVAATVGRELRPAQNTQPTRQRIKSEQTQKKGIFEVVQRKPYCRIVEFISACGCMRIKWARKLSRRRQCLWAHLQLSR